MQHLQYFPEPYPDECLYSIFCRYFVRSAETSHQRIRKELYGSYVSNTPSIFNPRVLRKFDIWFSGDAGLNRKTITLKHTMYQYMSIFYSDDLINAANKYIETGEIEERFERSQIIKTKNVRKEFLSYCPECVKEDIRTFGETYWHRLHQIQGVECCPKHYVQIESSIIPINKTTYRFRPASSFAFSSGEIVPSEFRAGFREQYVKIAKDIEWLLNHGLTLGGASAMD